MQPAHSSELHNMALMFEKKETVQMGRHAEVSIFLAIVVLLLGLPLYHVVQSHDPMQYLAFAKKCFHGTEPSTIFATSAQETASFKLYKTLMPFPIKICLMLSYWAGCAFRWHRALFRLWFHVIGYVPVEKTRISHLVAPLFSECANALKAIIMWPF